MRRRDALAASGVVLGVLAGLGFVLSWLLSDWPPETVPERIIYAGVGVATLYSIALFAISLMGYLLPRLVGLGQGPSPPGKA